MSKVIKAIVVVILFGLPHGGMSAENIDNSLGALEEIRAKTVLAEAQITYLEATLKLKDLESGQTGRTEFRPMNTPIMSTPPLDMSSGDLQMPVAPIDGEVLGVMGVDGKYSATIRTGTGIYKVSKGDKLSDGVVTVISLDKVVLKRAGKSESLPFAE